jgi:porphobilinogen synthase
MASISADFPRHRPRRLRTTPAMRDLVAETNVAVTDLIAPLFVREGIDERIEITSLPGVFQETRDSLCREVAGLAELGVRAVMLFGVPATKDPTGSGASDPDGIVQVALADLRAEVGDDVVLIADLCVDEYTSHGHCGIVGDDGRVDNDATLELYAAAAVAQATAGAQVVAPSGMMDGQVGVIRAALDDHGFTDVAILAYAAKYASGLYGPFRDAVDVTIADGGDRKGDVPLAAYHVSGEYSMIKAAAANGWIDHDVVALEQLTAVKRAGADIILTYLTRWFAERATGRATA